jgi:hypothetical protein
MARYSGTRVAALTLIVLARNPHIDEFPAHFLYDYALALAAITKHDYAITGG